jgi:O-antigen ligase
MIIVLLITGLFKFTRIGETVRALKEDSTNDKRIPQWISAVEVVRKAPVFGYGVGDGLNELIKQHEVNGFEEDVKLKSNAHNQFLETAMQTGILGISSLILLLLVPLLDSIRHRKGLLFLIVSIIFINMLFESLLVRIAGVLFIGFWMNFASITQSDPEL